MNTDKLTTKHTKAAKKKKQKSISYYQPFVFFVVKKAVLSF